MPAAANGGLLLAAVAVWSAASGAVSGSAGPVYNETTALLYAQYARVSFCSKERIESWTCGGMCVAARSVPGSVRYLAPGPVYGVQGYVARAPGDAGVQCVAAFRGTSNYNPRNWLADALVWRRQWPAGGAAWCPSCGVLFGYAGAYDELRAGLLAAIGELNCSSLALAGHSLGAGLAALAAVDLRAGVGVHVPAVWTFGKPRVGNLAFVEASMRAAREQGVDPPLWRVVHHHDIIPRVPWHAWGYRHEPLEVYYADEASTRYEVCPPTAEHLEDPRCMLATPWYSCTMGDHCNYLHGITFEESDIDGQCIPEQPSPWPMVAAVAAVVLGSMACCRISRRRHQQRSKAIISTADAYVPLPP